MSGVVVWMTGLPASGKSTLAKAVRARLRSEQIPVCILDSDEVRQALFPGLGYTAEDRDYFYKSLAYLAALLANQDLAVLVAATANRNRYRQEARTLVRHFIEVLVAASAEECAARDFKGLYSAAQNAKIGLPGISEVYEMPPQPDVISQGGNDADALNRIAELTIACMRGGEGTASS